jgi:hypothetical protein
VKTKNEEDMKIKNASEVRVGDVLKWGGETLKYDRELTGGDMQWQSLETRLYTFFNQARLQDLIDHGFEVTRKVEPVVFESHIVICPYCKHDNPVSVINAPASLKHLTNTERRVRVTVEEID